jgi:hypothetical protein
VGHTPLLGGGQHLRADVDPEHLAAGVDQGSRAEGNRAGAGPQVEHLLPRVQRRTRDDLLDHGREAVIDLPLVEVRIAVLDPPLPGNARTVFIG